MTPREWAEAALRHHPSALFMDGLDDAIIGVTVGQAGREPLVVYDEKKIIDALRAQGVESVDEAWEFYSFNIEAAYVGDHTPLIITMVGDIEFDTDQEEET